MKALTKIKKPSRLLFVLFLFFWLFFPAQKPAQAVFCWFLPCDELADMAQKKIWEEAISLAKQYFADAEMNAVGGSVGSMFIADWPNYLETTPQKEAGTFLDGYLEDITGGKGSANYASVDSSQSSDIALNQNFEGVGPHSFQIGLAQGDPEMTKFFNAAQASTGTSSSSSSSYISTLVENVKKAVSNDYPTVSYTEDPAKMFDSGNFKNLSNFFSGINNPWAFQVRAEGAYAEKLDALKEKAKTMAIANQGFIGKADDSGKIITPGSTVKDIVSNTQDIYNKIVSGATSVQEVLIASVTKLASASLKNGIASSQDSSSSSENNKKKDTSIKDYEAEQEAIEAGKTKKQKELDKKLKGVQEGARKFDGVLSL
jgi:hypothetical protein